jgi:hypothetical protein
MKPEVYSKLVSKQFGTKYVNSAVSHHQGMVDEFQLSEWENSIAKGGKLVEAVLKALCDFVKEKVPTGKQFKAGAIIDMLGNKPATINDTVRLTIPRACRFVYDVASNRGGRHDAGELDPNEMDASVVVASASWILAELLRFSQKGAMAVSEVVELISSLNQRKFPFAEDIDGRLYFSLSGLSARDVELLTLWKIHPQRMSKDDLVAAAKRHGNSEANAKVGLSRLNKVVDDDGQGNLRLRLSGVQQAEELIKAKGKSKSDK